MTTQIWTDVRLTLAGPLQETLEAIADGNTTVQIARRAHLSTATVSTRLKVLYEQLGAADRANAVAIGFRLGVLSGHLPPLPCVLADGVPLARLVAARGQAGISQREMAARLGVRPVWLCRRETGQAPFPVQVLCRYARIVGEQPIWADTWAA
jgi:DNA-binding CsgD family transcriptional regulator/DNA-binding XRE family transcriptional regulator